MDLNIDWTIVAPLFIIQVILIIIALIDLRKTQSTRGPKLMWVFIIFFIATLGPVIYFIFGRRDM